MVDLKKQFKLIKKINLAAKKDKKAVVWKDIVQEIGEGDAKVKLELTEEE